MLAHVGNVAAIGRELGIDAGIRRRSKLHRRTRRQIKKPKLPLRVENQVLRIRRPQVGGDVIARQPLFFAFVLHLVVVRRERGQLGGADQNFLLARRRVHIPEFAVLPCIVALHERELGPVGTPFHVFRTASGQPPGAKIASMVSGFTGDGRLRPKRCQQTNTRTACNNQKERQTKICFFTMRPRKIGKLRASSARARTNEFTPPQGLPMRLPWLVSLTKRNPRFRVLESS